MSNAKDSAVTTTRTILMAGDTGAGKTTQFLTLAGKKYAYLFDPNAIRSLRGYDIDYDEYLPSLVNTAIHSLTKEKGGDKPSVKSSDVYVTFENEFNERLQNGFFDTYDWVCFDSATTLLDLMMDRVLTINGRFGQWPQQDDYGPQMVAFINICRNLTAMGKGVYVTGHLDQAKQDKVTKKVGRQLMMSGRLIAKVPLLFSEVFGADTSIDDKGQVTYLLQTVRGGDFSTVRTSIKGLNPTENVTIDFSKDPLGQGLGGILNWANREGK